MLNKPKGFSNKILIPIIVVIIGLLFVLGFFVGQQKDNEKELDENITNNLIQKRLSDIELLDNDNFIFAGEDNVEMKMIVLEAFENINSEFDLDFDDKIEVIIYPTQEEFWTNAFPENKNNNRTTGFADHVNKKIYLTSINDTSIKSREEMLKVPVHELVHILIPHNWIDFREGIAVYLANQLKAYNKNDVPSNLSTIINYQGSLDDVATQYSFAGWKTKFIIEECFANDKIEFLNFIASPDKQLDYSVLGYNDEQEFLDSFRVYLLENSL